MTGAARFAEWAGTMAGLGEVTLGPPIPGGNSNVTRIVESNIGKLVLRHPPTDTISDRAANGIRREFAALEALYGEAPVPQPIAWCDDADVIGQPFSLTRFVDGMAITDTLPASYGGLPDAVDKAGHAMVGALAAVHSVDPAALVKQGLGRPDQFIERQIERWTRIRRDSRVRDLPLLEPTADWLARNQPAPIDARIVHCDFHLDNCLSSAAQPHINAIIDWEMATVADPRIDLGLALFFWRRDSTREMGFSWIQAFSNRPDVVPRRVLADHWSSITKLDCAPLRYFMAFSAWRLAAIVEGAYVLFRNGQVDTPYARALERDVPALLAEAAAIIEHEAA